MADRQHLKDQYPHPQKRNEEGGPSSSQIIALVALLPLGGILLGLAGLTLVGSFIGLAVATPIFVICSPVLVPAAIGIALAVTGFIASGAFGLTALSSLSWVLNSFRQQAGGEKGPLEYCAQGKIEDAGVEVGQKTKEVGQTIQSKAHHEGGKGREKAGSTES